MTPSEVASIARWLSFWEAAEYISETLVALGCFGEYVAEYTNWLKTDERKHTLGRRSLIVLILGISVGLLSLIKTNALSGEVIGSLGDQSQAAGDKAVKASIDADAAIGKVKAASEEADAAKLESGKAKESASAAESLARGARQEADSFEKRIVSATDTAIKAESHLAEALEHASKAEAEADQASLELARYRAPRSLTLAQQANIAARLRPFGSKRVDAFIVGDSKEISDIAERIITAIRQGGWSVRLFGKAVSGPSIAGVLVGTHIGSDTSVTDGADTLILALRAEGITSNRFRPQYDDELPMAYMGAENWDSKDIAPIRILIGAKP
jgi:hypothetical protein